MKKKADKQDASAAPASPPAKAVEPSCLPVEIIPIGSIVYLVDNHRPVMDKARLGELVENVRANGVKQPVKVCRRLDKARPEAGINVMVFGHRRVKASEMAGLTTIPAMVATGMTDQQIAEEQCIENIHREDVGPIGEAFAVKTLMDGGRTIDMAASMLNKPVSWAKGRLDLLRLCKDVQDAVNMGRLPLGHAMLMSKVGDKKQQVELLHDVIGYRSWIDKTVTVALAGDYVQPLKELRQSISRLLCKMGSAYWPKDIEYAGKRPCNGCPDNTNTEPALFDGITLTSAKGNCSNPDCYACKSKAWNKDPVKVARDKEREQQRKEKAKASGKQPEESGKRGESDEAREKRIAALKKKFPWSANQRFAVAMYEYGQKALSAVLSWLGQNTPKNLDAVTVVLICGSSNFYGAHRSVEGGLESALAGEGLTGKQAVRIVEHCNCVAMARYEQPGISYSGDVEKVPLSKEIAAAIALVEQLAAAWKVTLPARPKPEDFKDAEPVAAVAKVVKGTCRVCGCTEDKACPGGCAWVDSPKETLCSKCVTKESYPFAMLDSVALGLKEGTIVRVVKGKAQQ